MAVHFLGLAAESGTKFCFYIGVFNVAIVDAGFFVLICAKGLSQMFGGFFDYVIQEIIILFHDPGVQWLVFLCFGVYYLLFVLLTGRVTKRSLWYLANPDAWLSCLLWYSAISYAMAYRHAATSMQPFLLLSGATIGKSVLAWVVLRLRKRQLMIESTSTVQVASIALRAASKKVRSVVYVFILLFGCMALWQPDMGAQYYYGTSRRWCGIWDNPNTYGLLMAVGLVLAAGVIIKSIVECRLPSGQDGQDSRVGKTIMQPATCSGLRFWLFSGCQIVWVLAIFFCGFGLFKSYSRGAWLGTMIGLGCLYRLAEERRGYRGAETQLLNTEGEDQKRGNNGRSSCRSLPMKSLGFLRDWRGSRFLTCFHRDGFLLSVILASVLVLSFWQFRYTDWLPARRVFSAVNANDFSWRNRIAAWQGAIHMMKDHPLLGFGWGQAEKA